MYNPLPYPNQYYYNLLNNNELINNKLEILEQRINNLENKIQKIENNSINHNQDYNNDMHII